MASERIGRMFAVTLFADRVSAGPWRIDRPSAPGEHEEFRNALRAVLARSGLSMRGLSAAMGRDAGYVAALLDPTRPTRARPTPDDLLALSDAVGVPVVELLEGLSGTERARFAAELARLDVGGSLNSRLSELTDADRAVVANYIDFLAGRHAATGRKARSAGGRRR